MSRIFTLLLILSVLKSKDFIISVFQLTFPSSLKNKIYFIFIPGLLCNYFHIDTPHIFIHLSIYKSCLRVFSELNILDIIKYFNFKNRKFDILNKEVAMNKTFEPTGIFCLCMANNIGEKNFVFKQDVLLFKTDLVTHPFRGGSFR